MVTVKTEQAKDLLPDLITNYAEWEKKRRDPNGYFWQYDGDDGMEAAIGGNGYRPTINSYMYGDAKAIATIAGLCDKPEVDAEFLKKAEATKQFTQTQL